jgi:isocitrate/isopropylmalate dehydrogenase
MMLDQLGQFEAAEGIGSAIASVLRAGAVRTADLGGSNSTREVAEAIRDEMRSQA